MPKLILKNRNQVERELQNLFADLSDYPYSLDDLIWDDLLSEKNKYEPLFRKINKNEYIFSHYDFEAILQVLEYTYQEGKFETVSDFLDKFLKNITDLSFNEWVAIFPLEYSGTRNYVNFRGTRSLGDFKLLSPRKNYKNFSYILTSIYSSSTIDERLLEHQNRMGDEFLLDSPLLSLHLHGSKDVVRYRSLSHFQFFKWVHDLFVANFCTRSTLRIVSMSERSRSNGHFFLLNLKNGRLERCPLREGSRFLWDFDKNKLSTSYPTD